MKLSTLLVTLLIASLSFGQYIEQATLKLKKHDTAVQAKEIVYLDDKNIQFRNSDYPYVISYTKIKNIESLDFDSAQYHKQTPKLSETFMGKKEGKGIYATLDDVFNENLTDRKFKTKKIGYLYEFQGDLLDVVDGPDNKKIKDVAGVRFDGDLYLSIKNMWGNESDDNGAYAMKHAKNTFVRVKYINDDFLYFEMPLQTMGNFILTTSLGMFGGVGGALSSVVSTKVPENYRPIIMYKENHEVFIIKNCKEFNEHFEKKNSSVRIDCENDYNLNSIRKKIITEL